MKKILALLLALTMVFALATTAFAAGEGDNDPETPTVNTSDGATGSITIGNPVGTGTNASTYKAYKIFGVTYYGENYAYTISGTSPWYGVVAAYANAADEADADGLTLTASESDAAVFVVSVTGDFSAPSFAKYLYQYADGKENAGDSTSDPVIPANPADVEDEGKAFEDDTISGLELGYWFVTSSTGALCNLTTTNPSVTIYDKNDVPFEKVDDADSVEIGQTVNYTITGKVPDTTGFASYTYKITDTMTDGLTFGGTVTVKVGDAELDADYYEVDATVENGFELTIHVMEIQDKVAEEIEVTYSATVNENAVASAECNTAVLEYSNDPTSDETATIQPQEETVYSAKIKVIKVAEDDTLDDTDDNERLAGAKFVLYKEETVTPEGEGEPGTVKYYYTYQNDVVAWVTDMDDAGEVTTDANGVASFDGVADGTYYLLETEAPTGYNLLTDPVEIAVAGGAMTDAALTSTAIIENASGTELPSTGGMGTTMFYVIGAVLMLGAVVVLVSRKRMAA